jgi:hypothetical protein
MFKDASPEKMSELLLIRVIVTAISEGHNYGICIHCGIFKIL